MLMQRGMVMASVHCNYISCAPQYVSLDSLSSNASSQDFATIIL